MFGYKFYPNPENFTPSWMVRMVIFASLYSTVQYSTVQLYHVSLECRQHVSCLVAVSLQSCTAHTGHSGLTIQETLD